MISAGSVVNVGKLSALLLYSSLRWIEQSDYCKSRLMLGSSWPVAGAILSLYCEGQGSYIVSKLFGDYYATKIIATLSLMHQHPEFILEIWMFCFMSWWKMHLWKTLLHSIFWTVMVYVLCRCRWWYWGRLPESTSVKQIVGAPVDFGKLLIAKASNSQHPPATRLLNRPCYHCGAYAKPF